MLRLFLIILMVCTLSNVETFAFGQKTVKSTNSYPQTRQIDNDIDKLEYPDEVKPQKETRAIDNDIDELLDPNNIEIQPEERELKPDREYSQAEYEQLYRDLEVPTFSFIHGIDPDQYYDMKDTAWSPYPLMRLNSPIYFKSITIEPGYYLLTPRQYKGDWFMLFKEAGKVKYIIPIFEKNFTEAMYYHNNLKEVEMNKSKRWTVKFLDGIGRVIKRTKRKPPIKTNLELTDLDNKFLLIQIYYGSMRYKAIFRTEKF